MTVIFGYDKIIDNKAVPNGYKLRANNTLVNLGYATHFELNLHSQHFSNYNYDFECKEIEAITTPYYYVIDVYSQSFFEITEIEDSKNIIIPNKVLDDIKNNKAKILVLFSNENIKYIDNMVLLFNAWSCNYNIPLNKIILVSGNYDLTKFKDRGIEYIPYSMWEKSYGSFYLYDHNEIEKLIHPIIHKTPRSKVYLCYNRMGRYHRCSMVYKLQQKNLIKHGLVSLSNLNIENRVRDVIPEEFFNSLPMTFDDTNLNVNHNQSFVIKNYLDTYFSVVNETETSEHDCFPTEKIWKPIVALHPFMVMACPGFLEFLKSIGYKTYSKWFDESYDLEKDEDKRIDMIIKEIERMVAMSHAELNDMLVDMLPTLLHNYGHHIKRIKSKYLETQLEKMLSK